jgi:hypothetical protein
MKRRFRALLWGTVIGVLAPLFANAANVSIPAQELGTALQELAKQSGVQIVFFSKVVEGRQAPALNGKFTPEAAVAALLNGTGLTYHVLNSRAIEVAAADAAPADATPWSATPVPMTPIDEVEIFAPHEKLSALRAEIQKLEEQFYAGYNELNTIREYDIRCNLVARTGTHLKYPVCEPVFVSEAMADAVRAALEGRRGAPAILVVQTKTPDYQKNMVAIVEKHPELLELVKQRNALAERYEALRKQKRRGLEAKW